MSLSALPRSASAGPGVGYRYTKEVRTAEDAAAVLAKFEEGDNIWLDGGTDGADIELLKQMRAAAEAKGKKFLAIGFQHSTAALVSGVGADAFLGLRFKWEKDPTKQDLKKYAQILAAEHADTFTQLDVLAVVGGNLMNAELYTLLSWVFVFVRGNDRRPFGGLQVIFAGNFYLVCPVRGRYAFQCDEFYRTFKWRFVLTRSLRHTPEYPVLIDAVQKGERSLQVYEQLRSRIGAGLEDVKRATRLFANRNSVDLYNARRAGEHTFAPRSVVRAAEETITKEARKELVAVAEFMEAQHSVSLNVGSEVILLHNLWKARGLVKGVRCRVTGFRASPAYTTDTEHDFTLSGDEAGRWRLEPKGLLLPTIKRLDDPDTAFSVLVPYVFRNTKELKEIGSVGLWMIPLSLTTGLTYYACQGQHLEGIMLDLGYRQTFNWGQTAEALCTVNDLKEVSLLRLDFECIQVNPEVEDFYETWEQGGPEECRKRCVKPRYHPMAPYGHGDDLSKAPAAPRGTPEKLKHSSSSSSSASSSSSSSSRSVGDPAAVVVTPERGFKSKAAIITPSLPRPITSPLGEKRKAPAAGLGAAASLPMAPPAIRREKSGLPLSGATVTQTAAFPLSSSTAEDDEEEDNEDDEEKVGSPKIYYRMTQHASHVSISIVSSLKD
jgi:hypothetical protein